MSDISYIRNFTTFKRFMGGSSEPTWNRQLTGMPAVNPDVAIIRAVNWNGLDADASTFLIWSNLTNDYVASCSGGNISAHSPQIHIWLNGLLPNSLQFTMYMLDSQTGVPKIATGMEGEIVINIEFIKYKSVGLHA